jgi:hypothetical protein
MGIQILVRDDDVDENYDRNRNQSKLITVEGRKIFNLHERTHLVNMMMLM